MMYIVVSLLLNIYTGTPTDSYEQYGQPVDLTTCTHIITDLPPEKPKDGLVKVYGCMPEWMAGKSTL